MPDDIGTHYLQEVQRSMRGNKRQAEAAVAQLTDEELFGPPGAESNSAAVIMQHISGNQRSRFTDFLASDGEKPDRNRDGEFESRFTTREQLLDNWERSWQIVFATLQSLRPEDLLKTVTIRGEPLTVLQALQRQTTHYAAHVGQIIYVAKHWKGAAWQTLSIPKGKSQQPEALAFEKRRPYW
jgi:hypothetical protein